MADAENGQESECFDFEVVNHECFTKNSKYIDGILRFYPPVYIQRYNIISQILQEHRWKDAIKKIVDFGCSKLGLFLYLKRIPGLEEILEVDSDENVLQCYAAKAAPLHADYYLYERPKPLNVHILRGSISDYDYQLLDTDVVVAIEVIEHLEPEVFQKMPYNIFHEIKPKLAIFTTPNADFNVLFPGVTGFRHADHKFEWSRKEFYNWGKQITEAYPEYSVKFYGIGVGPEGSENLGCCTQMAVFERHKFDEEYCAPIKKDISNYKLIRTYEYPINVDNRSRESKILDEVSYRRKFSLRSLVNYNYDDFTTEIRLSEFMDYIKEWCNSKDELRSLLIKNGYHVEDRDGEPVLVSYDCSSECSEVDDVEDDNDIDELDISEISTMEFQSENWDSDSAQEDFTRSLPEKFSENESPGFLLADSLRYADDASSKWKQASDDGRGYDNFI